MQLHSIRLRQNVVWFCDLPEHLNISLNCNHSDILRQRTRDVEVKKYCITLLEKFGSFSHTRHILEELDAEAKTEVSKLGGNPLLEDILNELLSWKMRTDDKNPEQWGSCVTTSNLSSVHVWLVTISYLSSIHYRVAPTMKQDCGKCMRPCLWSMGILHGAHCMHYLLLNVIHLMSEKYVH